MPSPKKKKPTGKKPSKKAAGEKPAKKAASGKQPTKKAGSGKKASKKKKALIDGRAELERVLERLQKQIDDPENKDCVWVVELVIPPGIFMARRIPEPVDHAALNAEIKTSAEALNYGRFSSSTLWHSTEAPGARTKMRNSGRARVLHMLFSPGLRMKKKHPADKKAAKKTSAKKTSTSPVQPSGGKPAKPAAGDGWDSTIYPRPDMTPDEIDARYGTWAFLAGEPSDEESRAMVDDLWLLLNKPEEFRKRNPLANVMGIHEGRRPEKVHLHFNGEEAVSKVLSRQWHPTQDWRQNPDGTLDYWLEIAPCWQLKRWVLGFMGKVTVVSPLGFRAIIYDHARKMMEKYSKESGE